MRNSLGMEMVTVPAGAFTMGQEDGDPDEAPVHRVVFRRPWRMAMTPVTNAQFEAFAPEHRACRGRRGFSHDDDEAVVHVSWVEATAFCRWLSEREAMPYRLPTEAEWEYACRAGSTTPFWTGAALPEACCRHQEDDWDPTPVPLHVGTGPANAWGLQDVHGLVEEWCSDWYGPYPAEEDADPTGPVTGLFRVTRGGSHNTDRHHLRSAGRMGALPEDRHWLIGFRVVQAVAPTTPPRTAAPVPEVMSGVDPRPWSWQAPSGPWFAAPISFVHPPRPGDRTPFYAHNHCPALTWCANGDLLAIWYSTTGEAGREMTILASRRRAGQDHWDPASEFFKAPDRNMTGSSLYHDGQGTLYHANGIEAAGHWANLAMAVRTSHDHGATWSTPWLAAPEHGRRHQVIAGMSRTPQGWLLQPCDAVWGMEGGTALQISRDGGRTWYDPGAGTPPPVYQCEGTGGTIAGIHAGVVALRDGRFLALGRGNNLPANDGSGAWRMPQSVSADGGKTWRYGASPFPPISGGQRLVLLRLHQGPLLLISFTDAADVAQPSGLDFAVVGGGQRRGFGAFAALSPDEGVTWPHQRLLTDGVERHLDGGAWTGGFTMDRDHAEPRGYLAATQTPDGVIHMLSSRLHYQFDLAWLTQPLAGG